MLCPARAGAGRIRTRPPRVNKLPMGPCHGHKDQAWRFAAPGRHPGWRRAPPRGHQCSMKWVRSFCWAKGRRGLEAVQARLALGMPAACGNPFCVNEENAGASDFSNLLLLPRLARSTLPDRFIFIWLFSTSRRRFSGVGRRRRPGGHKQSTMVGMEHVSHRMLAPHFFRPS